MEWIRANPTYFCTGVGIVLALMAGLYLIVTEGGISVKADMFPESSPRSRRTKDIEADAAIIETAARLNQQGTGRERGEVTPVRFKPGCDPDTWMYAKWLKRHHPDALVNPDDVPDTNDDFRIQTDCYYGRDTDPMVSDAQLRYNMEREAKRR